MVGLGRLRANGNLFVLRRRPRIDRRQARLTTQYLTILPTKAYAYLTSYIAFRYSSTHVC
jgi:hypothetical protein